MSNNFYTPDQLEVSYSDTAAGTRNTVHVDPGAGKRVYLLKIEGSADAAGDLDIVSAERKGAGLGDTLESGTATSNIGGGTADANIGAGTAENHAALPAEATGPDSNTVLIAAASSFQTDNVQVGDTVINSTDGSSAVVVSVDSETQLTTTALSGGTADLYKSGDILAITDNAFLLYDSSETFVSDGVEVGDLIRNTTDGSSGVITEVTETTVTVGAGLSGGADDFFQLNDAYTIHSQTILVDSSETFLADGVAAGDLVLNTTDGSSALVVSVDSETQITTGGLTGGTLNVWVSTDTFTIHSKTILADSTATFITDDVEVGDLVTNTSDGSTALVVSVDSQTQLTTAALSGGTLNVYTSTDAFTVKSDKDYTQIGGKTIGAATLLNEDILLPIADAYKISLSAGGRLSVTYKEVG